MSGNPVPSTRPAPPSRLWRRRLRATEACPLPRGYPSRSARRMPQPVLRARGPPSSYRATDHTSQASS